MIEKVIEVNGDCKKVSIVGHSLGATVLPNALSKSWRAKAYVAQAILMTPCFIPRSDFIAPGLDLTWTQL